MTKKRRGGSQSKAGHERWCAAAIERLEAAKGAAAKGHWRVAYENFGGAVEFILKAIYLRNTQQNQMPADLQNAKSHDLEFMAKQAGISQEIQRLTGRRLSYWLTVRDWDHRLRYPTAAFDTRDGRDLKLALLNPSDGIWSWLLSLYLTN